MSTTRGWYQAPIWLKELLSSVTILATVFLTTGFLITPVSMAEASTTTFSAAKDTWIEQSDASDNHGSEDKLKVRSKSGPDNKRTLIAFDISSLPAGITITSALLRLRTNGVPNENRTYNAHRITSAWTESGATWDNASSTFIGSATASSTFGAGGEGVDNHVYKSWDVTSDVAAFYAGSSTNNGWLLKDQTENSTSTKEVTFTSRNDNNTHERPELVVVYSLSPGTIVIVKHTIGGDGTFGFTVTGTATSSSPTVTTSSGSGTTTLSNVAPGGGFSVLETVPAGWDLTSSSCSNGSTASTTVSANATTTCTFTNTKRGSITVHKDVVAPDGFTDVSDSHSFTVNLNGADPQAIDEGLEALYGGLVPGTYTITEEDPGINYDLVSITDNGSVTVGPGENVNVTVTNKQHQGTLRVIKHVVNHDIEGFSKSAGDFTMEVEGTNVSDASFPGDESGTTVTLDPGEYSVGEASTFGYAESLSNDCSGVMPSGGEKTCTITNSDFPLDQAALTVIKDVSNFDNGGTAGPTDFTLLVNDAPVVNGAANILTPDTYTVSEDPLFGYELNHIACLEGETPVGDGETLELVAGHAYICTVYNDDIPPSLTLVKHLNITHGGTATESDFTLTATSTDEATVLSGAGPSVSSGPTLQASTYTLGESGPDSYTASDWSCEGGTQDGNTITLGVGQSATCEITNSDQPKDVTPPVSAFNATHDHEIVDIELVQFSLSGTSTDNVGPVENPKSGVHDASMSIYRLADAQTLDSQGFLSGGFSETTCSNLGEQVPIEIVALSLTSVAPLTVSWDPIHQTVSPLTSLDRGVYCAVVHATDVAGNVENTAIAGPFAYTFTPPPPPPPPTPPSPPPSGGGGSNGPPFNGGGGGGGGSNGLVLGASTQGQVLGESCGLYMNQHLRQGSPKNNKDQVKKLQDFLNKNGFGNFTPTGTFGPLTFGAVKAFQSKYADAILKPWNLSGPTGLAYLTTLRQLNLLACPDLALQLPELIPWSKNPNAQ